MDKTSNATSLLCLFFSLLTSVYSCDTNPRIETDTITLSWPVCEYKTGEDKFYDWSCPNDRELSGVNVCVEDRPDIRCSKTTEEKTCFTIEGVPKDSEVLLSFKKEGFVSRLVPIKTGKRDFIACGNDNIDIETKKLETLQAFMFPPMIRAYKGNDLLSEENEDCKIEIRDSISPESKYGEIVAIVLEFVFDASSYPHEGGSPVYPVASTFVSIISPDFKDRSIPEPIYTNERGVPCYESGNRNGGIRNGFAIFSDLKPGDYLVKFDIPENYFCIIASIMADRMVWGFRAETPNQTSVPVRQGHSTITTLKCYRTDSEPQDSGARDADVNDASRDE